MGLPEIKAVVEKPGREYVAQRILLFASYARGDMRSESDLGLRSDKGQIYGMERGGLLLWYACCDKRNGNAANRCVGSIAILALAYQNGICYT